MQQALPFGLHTALTALLLAAGAEGWEMFKDQIPNGHNVKDCDQNLIGGIGHIRTGGGGNRNDFGLDFAEAGFEWTPELCSKDSDGDGLTNGQELGDPECTWSVGQSPQFDRGITHPGIDCDARNCETGEGEVGISRDDAEPSFGCEVYEMPATLSQEVTFSGAPVPNGTTYMLQAFTWEHPEAQITKFEIVNEHAQVNHHMIIYKCIQDMSDRYGTPAPKPDMFAECFEPMMAWAVGGKDFCSPEHLGFPIKAGEHLLIEIHYDNPNNLQGLVDHSGYILHGVDKAGSTLTEAGMLTLGVAPFEHVFVPPRKAVHRATLGFEAYKWLAMNETIHIFASMEHMHYIGAKQWLRATWEENGTEAGEIACNTNYDFDLQQFVPRQPFAFKRGMNMTLDCVWDSSDRDEWTNGGEGSLDEMCVHWFLYWPLSQNINPVDYIVGDSGITWSDTADKVCHCQEGSVIDGESPNSEQFSRRVLLLLSHGLAMIVAWCFFLPASAAVPLCWRKALGAPRWFHVHQALQLIGMVAVIAGLALALMASDTYYTMVSGPHKIMGTAIIALSLIQVLASLARPHQPEEGEEATSCRSAWLPGLHVIPALVLPASVVQIFSGASLVAQWKTPVTTGQLHYFIGGGYGFAVAFGLLGVCFSARCGDRSKEFEKQIDDVEMVGES